MAVTSSEWPDVVVWNPWDSMDCYKSFCCVENARFQPATVKARLFCFVKCFLV